MTVQATQIPPKTAENDPGWQATHAALISLLEVPTAQAEQTGLPRYGAIYPAVQRVHTSAPARLDEPMGQGLHGEPPCPLGQPQLVPTTHLSEQHIDPDAQAAPPQKEGVGLGEGLGEGHVAVTTHLSAQHRCPEMHTAPPHRVGHPSRKVRGFSDKILLKHCPLQQASRPVHTADDVK